MKSALVTGAGGFIGHHLVRYLKRRGYWVRGVDIKRPEFGDTAADEFVVADLRDPVRVRYAFAEHYVHGQYTHPDDVQQAFWKSQDMVTDAPPYSQPLGKFGEVYALAADMGGMGFISAHHAEILRNNLLINLNTLEAARQARVGRYFFSSSACVYPEYRQEFTDAPALSEDMAWPAAPQDAYGLEKLTTEELCRHYRDDYGMAVRIARFHNVYGPLGTWQGGREKAPAALCRKVAMLDGGNTIDIWGDGEQTRSFLYIDDCLEGIYALMQSDYGDPLNIGSDRMVSINELADIIGQAAGVRVLKNHIDGPQGVRGRNSDNTLCKQVLGWEPRVSLEDGIAQTYAWIALQVREAARSG